MTEQQRKILIETRERKNKLSNSYLDGLVSSKEFSSLINELSNEHWNELSFLNDYGWKRATMDDVNGVTDVLFNAYLKNSSMFSIQDVIDVATKNNGNNCNNNNNSNDNSNELLYQSLYSRVFKRLKNNETVIIVFDKKRNNKIVQTSCLIDLRDEHFYDEQFSSHYTVYQFAANILEKMIFKYETILNNMKINDSSKYYYDDDDISNLLSWLPCGKSNDNIEFSIKNYNKYCYHCMTASDPSLKKPIVLVITCLLLEYVAMKSNYQYFTGYMVNNRMKRALSNANTIDYSFDVNFDDFNKYYVKYNNNEKVSLTTYIENSNQISQNTKKKIKENTLFAIPIKHAKTYQTQLLNDINENTWKLYAKKIILNNIKCSNKFEQTQIVITNYQSKL